MGTPHGVHRFALLFNANKVYDRQIITGACTYLTSTRGNPMVCSARGVCTRSSKAAIRDRQLWVESRPRPTLDNTG